jgi:hypothetical protein
MGGGGGDGRRIATGDEGRNSNLYKISKLCISRGHSPVHLQNDENAATHYLRTDDTTKQHGESLPQLQSGASHCPRTVPTTWTTESCPGDFAARESESLVPSLNTHISCLGTFVLRRDVAADERAAAAAAAEQQAVRGCRKEPI